LDAESVAGALSADPSRAPVGIIPVDLFGHPANDEALQRLAVERGWWVLTDAAQSFGAISDGRHAGSVGTLATTSFFPAKPLGCFGDGGAVFCPTPERADVLRSLRNHGAGATRYENVRIGTNSRLDTIQAAVLLAKLGSFDEELARRQQLADRYAEALAGLPVTFPVVRDGAQSAWAQYTIRVRKRDAIAALLDEQGVATATYYATPLNAQPAFAGAPVLGGLPTSKRLCEEVLSLPIHPYLSDRDQARVVAALSRSLELAGVS
jgi:dTDP-4-amino-4,6-dideoxygalactose transaminase